MCEIWPRIPSPKTFCVLYVMVNLIKVKRTSIAVAIALVILFCVRINVQVNKICLEHILKGTGNTVVDKQKRRCIHPATMERV